jgi:transglutaminase-like putative cysteine protease
MDRRAFLQTGIAFSTAAALPWREALAADEWRSYEVVTKVEVEWPEGASRVWVPLPMAEDTDWQRNFGSSWSGNAARTQVLGDGKYGALMLYAEWPAGAAIPRLEVVSRVATRDRTVDPSKPRRDGERLSAAERQFYTAPTDYIPTDGIVRRTAQDIVKGARGDVDKARAIYEWVVENTFRDPKVRGCGVGDIKGMLETGNLGGKCADLNALFVGLVRSVGVPARDVYGVRIDSSAEGYRSLGIASAAATRAQHCRAEFYAEACGWVPVDPADVRKVALEEPPGNLPLSHPKVDAARKRLFGYWEMNWLAYNMGHDISLPNSKGPKLPYLMYPNGETGGERLDQLEPEKFSYALTARALQA